MWKTISSKIIFRHPRLVLAEDIVELPDGSQVPYLKYMDNHDAAAVICIKNKEVLLQREYSYPLNKILYQFPGGKFEPGETPQHAAARELAEEAGLRAQHLKKLGWFYLDNRRSNAKMHIYLATGLSDIEKPPGDPEEVITSHWLPVAQVEVLIREGKIRNYSLLAAWSLYAASAHSHPA
ncbi:MAG TPA: NUDIX hydrolase [Candidatus Limnocylindrales bacterium]|nr:NUDIX hydrolase [Candidatus Limnocylindrales bacterium]